MKRKKRWAAGLMLAALFLGGCSQNTKTQVVVPKKPKENSLLTRESEGTLADQVQAPIRYQCDKELSGYHLLANARVIVPEVEGIKLKKIKSRGFTREDYEKIQNTLFGEGNFYHVYEDIEREKAEAELAMSETEIADASEENVSDSGFEFFQEDVTQVEYGEAMNFEEGVKLLKDFLDGKKTFHYEKQSDFMTLEEYFAYSSECTGDWVEQRKLKDLQWLCMQLGTSFGDVYWKKSNLWNLKQGGELLGIVTSPNALYWIGGNNEKGTMPRVGMYMIRPLIDIIWEKDQIAYEKMGISSENIQKVETNLGDLDLQQQGNELIKNVSPYEMELSDVQDWVVRYGDDNSNGILEAPARRFYYTPVIDGVPITQILQDVAYSTQEEGIFDWPDECMYATYGKEGLIDFFWSAPSTVEDWHNENAFLLPFSEIQKIFEELVASNPDAAAGKVGSLEITVSEVRLGYVKVVGKDYLEGDTNESVEDGRSVYSGVLVPAWDFIGIVDGGTAEMYGVPEGAKISYMTINAMDGSIIQR